MTRTVRGVLARKKEAQVEVVDVIACRVGHTDLTYREGQSASPRLPSCRDQTIIDRTRPATLTRLGRVADLPIRGLLRVAEDDDDGVIGVDDDPMMRTAPLGVVSGAVVGVVTGLSSG